MARDPLKGRSEGEDLYGPREVLNELKYREGVDLARAAVWYVHRGAPDDTKVVEGGAIVDIGASFLKVQDGPRLAHVPMHRVFRVDYDGEAVWERGAERDG